MTGDPLYIALRFTQQPTFPPDRPVNTSRVKGLQKAAAVDRNKRLKMFWLKFIKTERVRSTYYVIIIQLYTEGSLRRGEKGKVEIHTHTHDNNIIIVKHKNDPLYNRF